MGPLLLNCAVRLHDASPTTHRTVVRPSDFVLVEPAHGPSGKKVVGHLKCCSDRDIDGLDRFIVNFAANRRSPMFDSAAEVGVGRWPTPQPGFQQVFSVVILILTL